MAVEERAAPHTKHGLTQNFRQGSPHQQLLMMQQPRAHKPGGASGKAKKVEVEEEEIIAGDGAEDIIASLTNAAMFG
eukprot:3031537-Rhodomonas_salina.2